MSDFETEAWGLVKGLFQSAESAWSERQAELERNNKLLDWKPRLLPNLNYSPRLFYTHVMDEVERQRLPGLEAEAVMMRQGGILSSRRLYLRLRRERLVFEICGFPFGTNFSVTYRLFDRRREARWYHYLLVFGLLGLVGLPLWSQFGLLRGAIIVSGFVCLLWSIMRLAASDTWAWLDDRLSDLPVVGRIYEALFRPNTYYRQDTNAAYRDAVKNAVSAATDTMTSAQGRKELSSETAPPSDLHKR